MTTRRRSRAVQILISLAAVLLLLPGPAYSTQRSSMNANIHIDNFGKINGNYYRGGQPHDQDYAALAMLGVKAVIDLRHGGPKDEPVRFEKHGIKFYRIPLTTSKPPSDAAVELFLQLVNDPANQPVFVH